MILALPEASVFAVSLPLAWKGRNDLWKQAFRGDTSKLWTLLYHAELAKDFEIAEGICDHLQRAVECLLDKGSRDSGLEYRGWQPKWLLRPQIPKCAARTGNTNNAGRHALKWQPMTELLSLGQFGMHFSPQGPG